MDRYYPGRNFLIEQGSTDARCQAIQQFFKERFGPPCGPEISFIVSKERAPFVSKGIANIETRSEPSNFFPTFFEDHSFKLPFISPERKHKANRNCFDMSKQPFAFFDQRTFPTYRVGICEYIGFDTTAPKH